MVMEWAGKWIVIILSAFLAVGCGGGGGGDDDTSTWTGTDGDADGDTDADGDADSDADTDGDTDPDGGADDTDPSDGGAGEDVAWVSVPGGVFQMGCVPQDTLCASDEYPRHAVNVAAFEMTRTEVTQAQYQAMMGGNPSNNAPCGGDCPVETVDWNQAMAFCEAIGARLPTEAEWEYAARAASATIYPCGDGVGCMDDSAWHGVNSGGATHPVGQKAPNAFGLYDMMGNVWEWNADCWHETFDGAPDDGSAWEEKDCTLRVLRGGQWCGTDLSYLRSSARFKTAPGTLHYYYGFRCARAADDPL
jgi:formylglycine-generating enzyme required for sulfatase activity